ncbi:histone deacetylase [candidate division WOR-3 bacterium]|nr:histone deacetylase [candidate division WOR-3 bacterium]
MRFVFSEKCLEYKSPGHPESPERVELIYGFLKSKGVEFEKPPACKEEDILRVHTKELLEKVKGENFFDPDTPALSGIYEHARKSAGGAVLAAEVSAAGDTGFSIMRPPGHHATRGSLGGFCYFNNMAIAVKKFGKKTAILDIDCHHGNGTEDIFLGDEDVLYLSLHRYGFFYPGSGGESRGNIKNYPLSFGIGENEYLETLNQALEEVNKFDPELVGVSVGFDTYKLDPVGGLGLEIASYRKIGELIQELNRPTFYVLEGGYSPDLPKCMEQFIG